ncbi:RAS2 protein [Friedmanniomyces endolithicus]|nr:RAS2 protein [Friedmanniomyces endolithicus]
MSHGKMTLYKLVVLGDGGVGKTALTIQLCLNHFVETYDPTIEDSYRKQVQIDGQSCMLEVLDRPRGKFHHQIQRVKESAAAGSPTYPGSPLSQTMGSATFGPAPVMLVGNKCDRVTEREVSTQEGSALAKQLGCDFVEASAKNCVNVEKAFYDVVRRLRSQRENAPRDAGKGAGAANGYPSRPYGYDRDRDDRYYRPDGKSGGGRRSRRRGGGGSKCVIL